MFLNHHLIYSAEGAGCFVLFVSAVRITPNLFFFLLSPGVPCVPLLLLLCVCEVLHSALEVSNCGYLFTCNSFIIFLDSNKSHTFQVS